MKENALNNPGKRKDNFEDVLPSLKSDKQADRGEFYFSRDTNKLSLKRGTNDIIRFIDEDSIPTPTPNTYTPLYKSVHLKVYQDNDNTPTFTVLSSDLEEGEMTIDYSDVGEYVIKTEKKVLVDGGTFLTSNIPGSDGYVYGYFQSSDTMSFYSEDSEGVKSDGILGGTLVEIRVYQEVLS